jgi:hypothetical protein
MLSLVASADFPGNLCLTETHLTSRTSERNN